MKNIEAILPHARVSPTIQQLRRLHVEDVIVESVKVFKKDHHQTIVYRGSSYDQEFLSEAKLHFLVSDEDATSAEAIVASASRN